MPYICERKKNDFQFKFSFIKISGKCVFANVMTCELQQQLPIVVAQNTLRRRPLSTAKVIAVSYVSFRYLKIRENPDGYDLRMHYEVTSLSGLL